MPFVVKRGGLKKKFSLAKARSSVRKALLDAGLPANYKAASLEKALKLVEKRAKAGGAVSTAFIRRHLLGALEKDAKAAAKAWRKFDAKYK